jgi:hypothetical protein
MIGIDDIVNAVSGVAGKLIDRLWPDPAQAAQAKLELLKMQQSGELAELAAQTDLAKSQLAVNQAEAANANVFVAGWRPFIGWVCGSGLAFQFIANPLLTWATHLAGKNVDVPSLDLGTLLTLLFGMLGLGYMRTQEKLSGLNPGR